MNSGYSSGWCEESFGIELTAVEILCKAKGDATCKFIMAPPERIQEHVQAYFKSHPGDHGTVKIPFYFKRKQEEDILRNHRDYLQILVEERTADLNTTKRQAETANRLKSEFLANMTHELRTPLNAIIGYSEMLNEEEEDADKQTDLSKITSAAKHLLTIINDILDLSKIEADKMEFLFEDFDLDNLINKVTQQIKPSLEKNNNILNTIIPESIGMMNSDERKVTQILLNLLSNAAKFTTTGTIDLIVKQITENNKSSVLFYIRDTGVGIEPGQLELVFQPFIQADSATTRKYGGTGLGLAITKFYCEKLGGTIHADSAVNKGSLFVIKLPLRFSKLKP